MRKAFINGLIAPPSSLHSGTHTHPTTDDAGTVVRSHRYPVFGKIRVAIDDLMYASILEVQ